jgi:hypothetical protein
MQLATRPLAFLAFITGALSVDDDDDASVIRYGPSNCIRISQSSTGSCMISTECQGVDTSMAEFGFSCVREGKDTEWHSYGKGGFEASEEFDSGYKCDECGGPASDAARVQSYGVEMKHIDTTPKPHVEYEPVPIEAADPPTQPPLPQSVTPDVVQESWQPSLWSSVPTAMQTPPSAPEGIMPGHHASSLLRGRQITRAQQQTIQASDSDADQDANANDEQSGAAESSKSESSQGSDDGWVEASVVSDPTPPAPTDASDPKPPAPNDKQAFLKPPNSAVQVAAPQVERFGPESCIATWRNPAGHCVLQTKCDHIDLSKVDVGMTCVNADGAETRHTFGKDSFDSDEEFDTMVECNKCTALRQDKTNKALTEKLQLLSEGIKDLEKGMESINENVQRLNAQVFRKPALTQTRSLPNKVARGVHNQFFVGGAEDSAGYVSNDYKKKLQEESEYETEQMAEQEEQLQKKTIGGDKKRSISAP